VRVRTHLFFICHDIYHVKNENCLKNFGLHLRKMRIKHKFSLRYFARITGVDKTTVQRIEKNEQNPSLDTVCSFAQAFDMKLKDFLDFEYEED